MEIPSGSGLDGGVLWLDCIPVNDARPSFEVDWKGSKSDGTLQFELGSKQGSRADFEGLCHPLIARLDRGRKA